ncbi:SLC13 family permease [Candidatus Nitrosocosmicus sp. T]
MSDLLIGAMKDIPESIPAILIILLIGLVRIKLNKTVDLKQNTGEIKSNVEKRLPKSWQPILSWNEILKSIDWNIIILFGGGLILGLGIEASGLATLLGDLIAENIGALSTEWGIFAMSAVMTFSILYVASNTASAVIVCPIATSLAIGAGLSPIPPIIAAGFGASISSSIPSTTSPMAIVYSSNAVTLLNMFKTGIISDILRLTILIILGPFLISIIYG